MAGAELLVRPAEERKKDGGGLYIYTLNEGACDHFRLIDDLLKIGKENIYETKRQAIAQIFRQLDAVLHVCPTGPLRKEDFAELTNIVDPFIEETGKLAGFFLETTFFIV